MKIRRVNLFWAIVNIGFIMFIIDMIFNTIKIKKDIYKLKIEQQVEESNIKKLESKKDELECRLENIDNEKTAREKLNMVKEGEKIYIIVE